MLFTSLLSDDVNEVCHFNVNLFVTVDYNSIINILKDDVQYIVCLLHALHVWCSSYTQHSQFKDMDLVLWDVIDQLGISGPRLLNA